MTPEPYCPSAEAHPCSGSKDPAQERPREGAEALPYDGHEWLVSGRPRKVKRILAFARAGLAGTLALTMAAFVACGGSEKAKARPAGGEAEAEKREVSDLDQPVERLLQARCEHEIPTYTCDECRYEVGVVKAPDDLFDAAKGGTLQKVTLGSRAFLTGKELNGEIRLDEEKSLYVSPRAPGVVRSIRVDLGSRVERGQVLFEVDSEELRRAKAEFLRAHAAHELTEASEERERELFERGICPRKDLLEAEAAHRETASDEAAARGLLEGLGLSQPEIASLNAEVRSLSGTVPVRAPFSGTVLERSLSLGAQVQPGDRLLLLADTSQVWVLTDLYEREVAAVLEAGKQRLVAAEVAVAAYPGRVFGGKLEHVGGTLDETTRTARARVVTDNPEGLLRAGMFARVRLLLETTGSILAVPEVAVLEDEGRSFVFIHLDGPYYIRRPVTSGRASSGWVEIAGGVKGGDSVVTQGAFLLKSDVLRSKMGAGCAD